MAILVTRPGKQGEALCQLLNQHGFATLHVPMIEMCPGRDLNTLPNLIKGLSPCDGILAVSKSAVHYARHALNNVGFHWRDDIHYFAVGAKTAQQLSQCTECGVAYAFPHENSEGLLAHPNIRSFTGKKMLILRGNGGRNLIAQQLTTRGIDAEFVETYQRNPIQYDMPSQVSIWKRAGISTIIVTSGEILRYLVESVPKNDHNWLLEQQLVTISARISQQALTYGWHNVTHATRADNMSILAKLCSLRDEQD
ncbi:uroporphyrinogen-III synthase [Spirabiliibacterium falconis]|uniref:uroporphyrinogen-III synthase n=1 Tax=Spirabiliibacterium falconis TaxID=572023 RepID=UPI001AAC8642|nr:uroporphyrinogen-III synthase [Spirabiliibacterium falconis]MBE2895064.1 uroporphyrinogen-III synthase [Spirabiliibacterium falconis]